MTINTKLVVFGATAVVATAGMIYLTLRGKKPTAAEVRPAEEIAQETIASLDAIISDLGAKDEKGDEEFTPIVQEEPTEAVPAAIVSDVISHDGESIVSVSRIRVAAAPMFWSHFHGKISRDQVMEVSSEDFSSKENLQFSRGWHKCLLDGVEGILHVTKGNVSAVSFGGGVFTAVSTSASRFGTKGPVEIDADRAKAYLNGH